MAIIDDIYDAMTDEAAYARLPGLLAKATRSRAFTMIDFDKNMRAIGLVYNYYIPAMNARYMDEGLYVHDVWANSLRQRKLWDKAILADEYVDRDAFRNTLFYDRMFKDFGDDTAQAIGAILRHSDGQTLIGMHRAYGDKAYDQRDAAEADELLVHLKRLHAIRAKLRINDRQHETALNALNALTYGMFVTDATGTILLMNSAAEAFLQTRRGVSLLGGKLSVVDSTLAEAFAHALATASKRTGARGGAMKLNCPSNVFQVLIAPMPGALPAALVLMNTIEPGHLPSRLLNQLYRLTPAEADLAAQLAKGMTPSEVADERTVTLPTVRTQIQKLISKLDARNLADVTRILARIPRLRG